MGTHEAADRSGRAPAVSVVIPTLDEADSIAACLASAAVEGVEVVISDGGSTDGTPDIVVEAFPAAVVVRGTRGRGAQLNRGAATSRGTVLLFLHADCRLPHGWLAAVRHTLEDGSVAMGCFRLHTGPPAGARSGLAARLWWRLLDLRSFGFGLPYGDQGYFLTRSVFEAVGGFPDIPLMEDLELARTCRRRGRVVTLPMEVRTTARRFARHPVRARVCTLTFPLLYRCGVSTQRLARWYGDIR